jgi:hypothetical protein
MPPGLPRLAPRRIIRLSQRQHRPQAWLRTMRVCLVRRWSMRLQTGTTKQGAGSRRLARLTAQALGNDDRYVGSTRQVHLILVIWIFWGRR